MNRYIFRPEIIKETSSGYIRVDITDELFKRREIECFGEITGDLVYSLTMQLRYLQMESPKEEITMHINSPGGEVSGGLALYDMMKAISCPVRTVCEGTAASMAAVLFLSGDSRQIFEHAKVLLHDPRMHGGAGGSALEIERASREVLKTRKEIGKIISAHTGKPLNEVYEATGKETWFNAKQCIKWGIADSIITNMGPGAKSPGRTTKKNGGGPDGE